MISHSWDRISLPWKNGFLVTISTSMQPIDHTSTGNELIGNSRRSSGALYQSVTTSVSFGCRGTVYNLVNPKSATFTFN